jgi:4,5-DOPA dioxygenase extradiol
MTTDGTSMPAAFIGHGSPMNALETNRYTEAWQALAAALPAKPRAILAISAHWYWNSTAVTAMATPRTIHDFFGFPKELSEFRYDAPGDPDLAAEIIELVKPTWVGTDNDAWGLDHGTWVVLARMFPEADVPVVQLAINADKPLDYHFELGAQLASLRRQGVLILGSGNVVHNLRLVDFAKGEAADDWAARFDTDVRATMTSDPAAIGKLAGHADFRRAAPTPDHYIPLLYVAGVASASGQQTASLAEGYFGGSLSMTSYVTAS